MKRELPRPNGRITGLAAPILEGGPLEVEVSSQEVAARALGYAGRTYVLAVDLTRGRQEVTIAAEGARGRGTIDNENREVQAKKGAFSDAFGPLGEHTYVF